MSAVDGYNEPHTGRASMSWMRGQWTRVWAFNELWELLSGVMAVRRGPGAEVKLDG